MIPLRFPLILLTVLVAAEAYQLFWLGPVIGFSTLLLIWLGAALIGVRLLQTQGFSVWQRVQRSLVEGRPPTRELLDGALVMLGALLLLAPGIITDLLSVPCLIPMFRKRLAAYLIRRYQARFEEGGEVGRSPEILEGEFRRID